MVHVDLGYEISATHREIASVGLETVRQISQPAFGRTSAGARADLQSPTEARAQPGSTAGGDVVARRHWNGSYCSGPLYL